MLYADPMIRGELLDDPISAEAAKTTVLFASEWTVRQIVDGLIVDVRHAGFHLKSDPHPSLDIPGEHGARQAVLRVVRHPQCLLFTGHLYDGDHRAEHFVLGDLHAGRDIGKDMRRQQEALGISAGRLPGSAGTGVVDMLDQTFELRLVNDRADRRVRRIGVADFEATDTGREALDEPVIDRGIHDEAVRDHTDLSLVKEFPEDGGVDGQVNICIVEDDEGTVSPEFEGHSLDHRAFGGEFRDVPPDRR